MNISIGSKVMHERYGKGIVSELGITTISIIFIKGGEMQFSRNSPEIEVIQLNETNGNESSNNGIDLKEIENMICHVLDKYGALQAMVELGQRWHGGEMILQPANKDLQSKTIPIETFFHKIVMARDRLRVLEQNINSHPSLSDEEKVHLQQYITRVYGSFTTFNILFNNKEDYFSSKGEG